jgi:mercuric reductase
MSSCCDTASNEGAFDLAVIGAGSAGFAAAIAAAEQGARVALIGHGVIGGTCVNAGCVPSKTLLRAAEALHQARAANRFAGIDGQAALRDWRALVEQKDQLVDELRAAKYSGLLPAYNTIAYREGRARLVPGGVAVDGLAIGAPKIVIATGASAAIPGIPGIDGVPYLTSATAMTLDALPRSLLVVGGGYIGCELAQLFARLGVQVTLVCRRRLLPEAEPEIAAALAACFAQEGITVRAGVEYRGVRTEANGIALDVRHDGRDEAIAAERLLIAAGRRANSDDLGLDEAGVARGRNGGITVDDRMRTTRPGAYAAGDVTGRDQFVYMAAHGAKVAALNALNGDSLVYANAVMPAVVFTDPQAASVGLTEAQAVAAGHTVRTSILPLTHLPRALAARDTRGLVKLVAEAKSLKLLGAHLLAPEGGDTIQVAAIAIKAGMTAGDLAATIFPYLTTAEALKLAALGFAKDVAKLSCCAG